MRYVNRRQKFVDQRDLVAAKGPGVHSLWPQVQGLVIHDHCEREASSERFREHEHIRLDARALERKLLADLFDYCFALHLSLTLDNDFNSLIQVSEKPGQNQFEVVGNPRTMTQGIDLLTRGGALTLVGAASRDASLTFAPRRFMSQQQTIRSCIYGNIYPWRDLPLFAQWYLDGRLEIDSLLGERIALAQVPDY